MTSNVWFQGSINEAVQLVNAENCLFVVFIHDDSGTSAQLDELLTSNKIQNVLRKHVSIKLDRQSENAQMFGQYYPIQRVPMVYFIKQGVIKDFAIETTTEQEFIDKADHLTLSSPDTNIEPPAPSSTAAETSTSSSEILNYIPTSPTRDADSVRTTSTDTANDQGTLQNNEQPTETTTDSDKKARLKQQMEEARAKRDEIEKENEKKREMKRRQDGKEAQLTQQQLQDQQNKLYFAKIKKEKQADEEHRRKVKEQIARDRKEKMAERQRQSQQSSPTSSSSISQQQKQKDTRLYDVCSLNIRQGDGANMRHTFNAQNTLGEVRTWIDENRTDGDQPYKLLAQFPTRQFSAGDEEKALRMLDLIPSGTIIMKPIKNVASAYESPSGYGGLVADYVYSAGGMVYNTLSGVGTTMTGALGGIFNSVAPEAMTGRDGRRLGGPQQQQQQSSSPSGSRQIHGINTLRQQDQADDDDRKRTYNGNSINQE